MTRSITIVNTSNWDGEDYLIGIPGVEGQVRMRPGESVEFTPPQVQVMEGEALSHACQPVELDAVEEKTPMPFYKDTVVEEFSSWPKIGTRRREQVKPRVRVYIE